MPFLSVRIVLPDPFGADCMPGGVSPCGLAAGAPPDLVLIGPVFPCGWATFPLGLLLDCGSAGFGCAKTVVDAHKMKIAVIPMILRDMLHLQQTQTLSGLSATTPTPRACRSLWGITRRQFQTHDGSLIAAHPFDLAAELSRKGIDQPATEPGIRALRIGPLPVVGDRQAKLPRKAF